MFQTEVYFSCKAKTSEIYVKHPFNLKRDSQR